MFLFLTLNKIMLYRFIILLIIKINLYNLIKKIRIKLMIQATTIKGNNKIIKFHLIHVKIINTMNSSKWTKIISLIFNY
jgi:hypothetical protein